MNQLIPAVNILWAAHGDSHILFACIPGFFPEKFCPEAGVYAGIILTSYHPPGTPGLLHRNVCPAPGLLHNRKCPEANK